MQLKMMGMDYRHKQGEFCKKLVFKHYTVCCFATPFVYLRENRLCKGDKWQILINTPNSTVYHGPQANAESSFVNDWFYIAGEDFGILLEKYPLPLNRAFSVGQSYFLRKFGNRLSTEFGIQEAGASDIINCIFTEMVIELHRAYNKTVDAQAPSDAVCAIKQRILLDPQKRWTLEEMSLLSGYSVSRFCELYRKMYGISPINDVIRARIELAKKLLYSGQATVSMVAEACGFSTINYFSNCFKRVTGQSPAEYAKNSFL